MTTNNHTPNHRAEIDAEQRIRLRRITDLTTQMRYAPSKEAYVDLARERRGLMQKYNTVREEAEARIAKEQAK